MRLTVCRVERMRQGLTSTAKLARTLGIPQGRLRNWESGQERRYLSADEVERLAGALCVAPETIADGRGAPVLFS